jgi:hypothetical protein
MAATYYNIGQDEFEAVMNDYDAERVPVAGTKELVYHIPTEADGVVVRVFSSLTREGVARDAGSDAIRVLAWSTTADQPLASSVRTHRIDTWEKNLRPKIEAMVGRANDGDFDEETPDAVLRALEPAAPGEDAVVVADIVDTRYGRKAALEAPYEANDAIRSLGWGETHRTFDESLKAWTVDASSLPAVAGEMAAAGFPLRAPAEETDGFDPRRAAARLNEGDAVVVEYDGKNDGKTRTKAGVVTSAEDGRIVFERDDDGHTMWVDEEGLSTSGSAYPFVGEVVRVLLEL